MTELEGLLNTEQAAQLLGVRASWVKRQVRAGAIPHIRLGRYLRFDPRALREWWAAQQTGEIAAKGDA